MLGHPLRRVIAGAALMTAAALTACGNQPPPVTGPGAAPTSASPTPSASPSEDTRPKAPLTGAPVDPAVATRPAVAVVVAGSAPVGLEAADIVLEEISNPIRWVALYQSREADSVGPVAATRPNDVQTLSVIRPAYAFRGGTNGMVQQAQSSALLPVNASSRPDLFATRGADLFVSTAKARSGAKAPAAKPLLVYGDPATGGLPGSKPARQVVIGVKGSATQVWRYDDAGHLWRRVSGGPGVAVANLIVQVVEYKSIQLGRRDGGFVPSARVFGEGASTVVTGPMAVSGKWRKPGLPQLTTYADGSSVPVRLAPGSSWILLAPIGTTVAAS
jgi:hypothetical protein